MKISRSFLQEAMGYVFDNSLYSFNHLDDQHRADPYLFDKALHKLSTFIEQNPKTLHYFKVALVFLYANPKLVHPGLISVHSIPFTPQEIRPILAQVFQHLWPGEDIATYDINYLGTIEIADIPEEDWKILTMPNHPSEEGLFD